jgi:hypothetical protein
MPFSSPQIAPANCWRSVTRLRAIGPPSRGKIRYDRYQAADQHANEGNPPVVLVGGGKADHFDRLPKPGSRRPVTSCPAFLKGVQIAFTPKIYLGKHSTENPCADGVPASSSVRFFEAPCC